MRPGHTVDVQEVAPHVQRGPVRGQRESVDRAVDRVVEGQEVTGVRVEGGQIRPGHLARPRGAPRRPHRRELAARVDDPVPGRDGPDGVVRLPRRRHGTADGSLHRERGRG